MDMGIRVTEKDSDLNVRELISSLWEGSVTQMRAIDLLAREVDKLHNELRIYRSLAAEYSKRLGAI